MSRTQGAGLRTRAAKPSSTAQHVALVRAIFTVEGLTMYLTEAEVAALLTTLARLGGPGSRVAVNFGVGRGGSRLGRLAERLSRIVVAHRRERITFELSQQDAQSFLAATGWTVEEMLTGPELAQRYVAGTGLPTAGLSPRAFVVAGTRS